MSVVSVPPVVGPGRLPITRTSFKEFSYDLFASLRKLHADHGPIGAVEDGAQKVVFLFHPEYNQQVLSDTETYQARFFAIRGPRQSSQRRVTCGLLAMNGDQHKRNRRLVKERFSLKATASYQPAVETFCDELLHSWQRGETYDINREMTRYMLKVTSSILFGLEEPEFAYQLGEEIADWVSMNHDLGVGALVPDATFSSGYEDLLGTAQHLEQRVMQMIHRRRTERTDRLDVLSILVRSHDEQGGLSDEELVGQACVLFSAAHMTTAHSLTWTLLLLAQHPQIQRELAASIVTGDQEGVLDRVIKESMRILPASAYSQRITHASVKLGPFDLPRGTPIVFTPLITHHLPEFYSEPKRFDPDRWLTLEPAPYQYIPFGGGPRLCIGGPLALDILRTTLPRIISRFTLAAEANADVNLEVRGTMLQPRTTVPIRLGALEDQLTPVPLRGNVNDMVNFFPS